MREEIFDNVWKNGLIIFDTCSLLRMYEYKEDGAIELKDILDYKRNDIWLPNQVKKEFDRKHAEVMNRQLNKYTDAVTKIKNNPNRYENEINGILKECEGKRYSDGFISELGELLEKIQNDDSIDFFKLEETAKISEKNVLKFYSRKIVEGILSEIFKNIGDPLSDEARLLIDFNTLIQSQKTLRKKINWTREKQSGDFIVWQQILRKAKGTNRPILFVTADVQPNFWLFDKQINRRVPHPALISEYKNYVGNEDTFNMITLHDFFALCSNYLNSNVEHIIEYMQIDEQIIEKLDTWFPEELTDAVNEYLTDDSEVKFLIADSIDSCYDYPDINGFEFPDIEEIEYSIDEDVILYEGRLTIYVDVDAKYHCNGEDGTIASTYLQLRVSFSCYQNIDWQSLESGRMAIENKLYNIEVSDPEVIWIKENEHNSSNEDMYEEPEDFEYEDEEPDFDGLLDSEAYEF